MADTPPITLADLTTVELTGTGAFDKLMQALRLHLKKEFDENRLKGAEYAQVLSSSITAVMQNAVGFLLSKDESSYKADLIKAQIELINKQIEAQVIEAQLTTAKVNLTNEQAKLPAAQIRQIDQAIVSATYQDQLVQKQIEQATAQILLVNKQVEAATQDILNSKQQLLNLVAQECLLRGQYDLVQTQVLNTTAQTTLVSQKTATERAQIIETGVDDNSVIGRQKILYKAQSDGFQRDAEQKAAKILADSWSVRRTTDEGTVADVNNMLYDTSIGRAITKMLNGVNA